MEASAMRRRCGAELTGTFGIVFVPVALSAGHGLAGAGGGLMASAWASGLAVLAMVYALGHISAAHFNPAVTLGFAVARRFPWRDVAPYWLAQFAGAILAAGLAGALFGYGHGVHIPAVASTRAVGIEAVLTFFLMLVIMAVATDKRANGSMAGLAIGLTVVMDILAGGAATGGSMNPARTLGPALFAGHAALAPYWIYVAGPAIGAVVAARLYEVLRGDEAPVQISTATA